MKIKLLLPLFIFSILFMACGGGEGTSGQADAEEPQRDIDPNSAKAHFAKLGDVKKIGPSATDEQKRIEELRKNVNNSDNPNIGYYVGKFGKNMINIALYMIEDGKAEGFSVCAGNYRFITGTYTEKRKDKMDFVMDEPGDDQYDGRFEFTLFLENPGVLEGKWTPFEAEGNSPKTYTLNKSKYKYDMTVGDFPETSQRKLTEADVENVDAERLRVMRSEIYARHGYSFKEKDMRYYFEDRDWYMPLSTDVRENLTEIENENINLIYEYETYYEEYYDDYGR